MKLLFLDLEDTIITPTLAGWTSCEVLGNFCIHRLLPFMRTERFDRIGIFSFAIDNAADKDKFATQLQGFIEKFLGVKFTIIPHVEEIVAALRVVSGINGELPLADVVSFWGKAGAFHKWIRWMHSQGRLQGVDEIVFIDDSVETETWLMFKETLEVRVLNIEDV